MPPISWHSPTPPRPGWRVPARWPGWSGWKPSTTTWGPRCPGRFWWFRGHAEEFARYEQMIVGKGEKLPPDQRGYAQNGLGIMLIASGNRAQAQVLFEQALALFRQLGDKLGIAITTGSLGHLTALRREYTQATLLLTESLALHQELGNDVSIKSGLNARDWPSRNASLRSRWRPHPRSLEVHVE
jgi:hypothetical protein